jgi:D-threo-aldose 1-dehydrogenase
LTGEPLAAAEPVRLGRTSLTVSKLGLGTAPLGGLYRETPEKEALAVVERAYELGLRFFDTAPLYGMGLAEQRLGEQLRRKPRDDFVLATKVGRLLRGGAQPDPTQPFPGAPPLNPVFDFSYEGVLRSLDESLSRLGLDRVDIVHIHDPDQHHDEALNGAYRALDRRRSQGVVSAVGAGMNQSQMLARFAREANFDCFLLAGRYTLLDQGGLRELLPACQERGIAVIAGGVFNSGILAAPQAGATYDYAVADPVLVQRAQRIGETCARWDVPLKAAAVQFPLGHPAVTSVLVGCRSVEELEEDVRMFEHPIPHALWQELKADRLLPERTPVPGR